jgi:hypothetical protein
MSTVDHGFRLSAKHFFHCQDGEYAHFLVPNRRSLTNGWWKRTSTHQEVDLDLNLIEGPRVILVPEIPLHQGMIVNASLDFISEGNAHAFDRPDNLWTLVQHFFTAKLADVVQINVDPIIEQN